MIRSWRSSRWVGALVVLIALASCPACGGGPTAAPRPSGVGWPNVVGQRRAVTLAGLPLTVTLRSASSRRAVVVVASEDQQAPSLLPLLERATLTVGGASWARVESAADQAGVRLVFDGNGNPDEGIVVALAGVDGPAPPVSWP